MSNNNKNHKKKRKYHFSKNLRDLRSLAVAITKNRKISINYDVKAKTSKYNPESDKIVLSLNPYPEFVQKHEVIGSKCLDADLGHECGHAMLSKPLSSYFNNWVTKIKRNRGFPVLAHHIVNLIEDKRVNYYIENRYRFDLGKRLTLANLIIKDTIETQLKNPKFQIKKIHGEAPLIVGILANEGLYEAEIPKIWKLLSKKAKQNTKKALTLMEQSKYMRLRIDLIKTCQQIYDLIVEFLDKEDMNKLKILVPSRMKGELKGKMSQELKAKLQELIKKEVEKAKQKAKEKLLEDLLKGMGAGQGTGKEIPTPEPDFNNYQQLLEKNKPEIQKLLDLLKQRLKPKVEREIFRKRGRFMSQLLSKAYTNSLRNVVKNVYVHVKTRYEKEKVAIGFLFDFSGSVDRTEANDITIILNEVFGHFVDDYGFSISCFGADSQKIKTFFETFKNTKARCGNIGVSAYGTEISVLLKAYLRMFNTVDHDRRRILVIASDFMFGDNQEALKIIPLYEKANIELIFIGFCNCRNVDTWAKNLVKARRTKIKNVHDLPEMFLSVYSDIQL